MPKSNGGSNRRDNIVIACIDCNRRKRDIPPEEWLQRIDAGSGNKLADAFELAHEQRLFRAKRTNT